MIACQGSSEPLRGHRGKAWAKPGKRDSSTGTAAQTGKRLKSQAPGGPQAGNQAPDHPNPSFRGTLTLRATNLHSGNTCALDGDVDAGRLWRLDFPKGGWVTFPGCRLDNEYRGTCLDEHGHQWSLEGRSGSPPSPDCDESPPAPTSFDQDGSTTQDP